MGSLTTILKIRLPQALRAELEQLAEETGRSKSDCARQAITEFLEDRADYLRAVAALEREQGQPNTTLEQLKRELALDD